MAHLCSLASQLRQLVWASFPSLVLSAICWRPHFISTRHLSIQILSVLVCFYCYGNIPEAGKVIKKRVLFSSQFWRLKFQDWMVTSGSHIWTVTTRRMASHVWSTCEIGKQHMWNRESKATWREKQQNVPEKAKFITKPAVMVTSPGMVRPVIYYSN